MSQDILTAIDPLPEREEVVGRTRALMELLNSPQGQDAVVVLTPESLEHVTLDHVPTYDQRKELVGGELTSASTRCLRHHTMTLDDSVLLKPGPTINLIASLLYATGHPICGVVVLMPHSSTECAS